ncbi:RICIN domain-containing protein [Myceligenerans indicum]|uniref:CBM6 domain-containing protein n=1 Tax=Myceligenerans indicum TaxID=2593663 RepID=A0ABS1LQU5_9MICO|nr:RICIN domain-containing protein [Myceligenerans indicum]MBL0888605.1 hypothetical protein [Myceligenerans indicum]
MSTSESARQRPGPRRSRLRRTAAVLATAAVAATSLVAAQPAAAATDTLVVDFGTTTGAFRGGASGTLYGFGNPGVPSAALVNGAHITNSSQRAPYGTQHPSGDALLVEDDFFAKNGQELAIYVQDYYPDWSYNGGQRPGDSRTYDQATGTYTDQPNGVWDYLEVVEFVTEAVATQSDRPQDYLFIPFNEPDGGNWYPDWANQRDQFLTDWSAAYAKIQEVYARHGLGHARIGGPGDTRWQPGRSADILAYARDDGSLPDVFIWHELGIDNLATYRSHFSAYRDLEQQLGISPIPVNITEYGMLRDMGVPGQLVQWFAMFEDTKVDAQTAYWNYAGNLSDNTARPNGANGGWWMFKWYGDLAGSETVQVTPPQLNAVDTLQGIGAIDTANRRATVLYGGTDSDVQLDLRNLPAGTFGSAVDVEVREVTLSGAEGLAGTPRVVQALDGVALSGGTLDLTVATYDRYAAYQVIVTPAQDRTIAVDPVWRTSTEAEDTTLTSAQVYTQDPQGSGGWQFLASGGSDVGSFNQASSRADWDVTVPRDGTYRFQVIGATPGKPGRHALFVDGTHRDTIQYTADLALNDRSKWKYRGSAELAVTLTAGSHTLSVRASEDGSTVLPNSDITLDRFVLTDVTDGEPTTYPASTLRYDGGAGLGWQAGTRGYGQIGGSGQRADAYVTAMETGYYDVAVEYSTSAASDLRLDVGGRTAAAVQIPGAGFRRTTVRTHLTEGINELELRSAAGIGVKSVVVTRATDGDSAATTFEAESLPLGGNASVQTAAAGSGSNASGGQYVGYVGNDAANTITIPRGSGFSDPGDYDLVVHYANAELSGAHAYNPQVVDRRLVITEGGQSTPAGTGYFRYTYAWDSFWQRTIPVTLTGSTGDLTLGNPTAWAPDIDKVTVAPLVAGTPSTVTTGTPTGSRVVTNRHSDLCLDDYGWETAPGSEVRQWTCNGLAVQDWDVNDLGNGYVELVNGYSGLCLEDKDAATANGALVQQNTCDQTEIQQWEAEDFGGGWYRLRNRHAGLCLDDYNLVTTAGAEVRLWTCHGDPNQQWSLT